MTPTPLEASGTPMARGTFAAIEPKSAAIQTAEAVLPVAAPLPSTASTIIVGTVAASAGPVMTAPELTAAMITTAMAKADARVCIGNPRCYPFPDRLEDARASCTPKGRCKVGWILANAGRDSWDVWLEVRTGLVKLIRQADA